MVRPIRGKSKKKNRLPLRTFALYRAQFPLINPQGAAPKVACHWAMDFIPFREVSPMSISFRMALLTTNYSLLTDIAPHGISVN